MSNAVVEEETGPSVDSENAAERVEARRQRIVRRQEAQRRAQLGEDLNRLQEVREEMTISRQQMEHSYVRLTKLRSDGFEMVTNIRVAGDAHEISRRVEEEEAKRHRKDKLDAEAKSGAEKFEEITKKWETAMQKEIPQDLHEMLMQQKTACDSMLDEKNKLITDYQTDLKSKDDQYVKDLKKQAEEIDLLIERMDNQVHELTLAYRGELEEIERAFVLERTQMLDQHRRRWDDMMTSRREKEVAFMKARDDRVEDYDQQLQQLRLQDAEEYNQVKAKLESDVQILQQQLQQMKATYQLNQEKLEYNFQVLRKRDEENTVTKSQQKRKITRMQDVLTNTKRKLVKQEKQYRDDNQGLTEDYKRITEQVMDVQRKSKHFMATDEKKFQEIWIMNEEECKQLVNKLLLADRLVHEHQLGIAWETPDVEFTKNVGPLLSDRAKNQTQSASAKQYVQEVLEKEALQTGTQLHGVKEDTMVHHAAIEDTTVHHGAKEDTTGHHGAKEDATGHHGAKEDATGHHGAKEDAAFSPTLIKMILELLCDESGFLIEAKLLKLLEPLPQTEQTLMKLDAIFSVLGVESEDDVIALTKYFAKHQSQMEIATSLRVAGIKIGDRESCASESSIETQSSDEVQTFGLKHDDVDHHHGLHHDDHHSLHHDDHHSLHHDEHHDEHEHEQGSMNLGPGEATEVESCSINVLVHPNDVLRALKAFVDDHHKFHAKDKLKNNAQFNIVNVNERDESEDPAYWAKYPAVITADKEKLWDALIDSFEKYHEVLTARAGLLEETDVLRQQNAELRILLQQYVNAKVNQELEIPPTRVMDIKLN